jgi:hypothetical protein
MYQSWAAAPTKSTASQAEALTESSKFSKMNKSFPGGHTLPFGAMWSYSHMAQQEREIRGAAFDWPFAGTTDDKSALTAERVQGQRKLTASILLTKMIRNSNSN